MKEERKLKRINFDKFNDENKKGFDLITLEKAAPTKFKSELVPTYQNTWEKAIANSTRNNTSNHNETQPKDSESKNAQDLPQIGSKKSTLIRSNSVKPMIHTSPSDFFAPGRKGYMPITEKSFNKMDKPLFAAIKTGGFNYENVRRR